MAIDMLKQALSPQSWKGRLSDEPGLEQPALNPILLGTQVLSPALMGALGNIGENAPPYLANEAGAIFPKSSIPPNIQRGDFTVADLLTPAEKQYKLWENTAKQYAANEDYPGVLRAKWGMLKNAGGN